MDKLREFSLDGREQFLPCVLKQNIIWYLQNIILTTQYSTFLQTENSLFPPIE